MNAFEETINPPTVPIAGTTGAPVSFTPECGMTIREAINRFNSEEGSCTSPALREVINSLIDRNIKTEFENDSYLDALTLTSLMFTRSTKAIRILTGPSGDGFLNCLKKPLLGALERIKANNGQIRVIILGSQNDCLDDLKAAFPKTLEVIPAKSKVPLKHFTVCDSKMARMEQLHADINLNSAASTIKARVCFNDPAKSKAMEDIFDQIWNSLKSQLSTRGAATGAE